MTDEELHELEDAATPGRRRLRRPVHRQHDGDGVRGARHLADGRRRWCPAEDATQGRGRRRGRQARRWTCSRRGQRPSDIITRDVARERDRRGRDERRLDERRAAPARGRAARRASSSTIDDFDRDQRAHAAAVRPQARRPVRRHRPLRGRRRAARARKRLREAGVLHARRDHRHRPDDRRASPTRPRRPPGQHVVRPLDDPIKPTGGLAILRGNLAPEGCVVKLAGHERRRHTGPARVFEGEEDAMAAVTARQHRGGRRRRDPQRGPGRRPGHARDARASRRRSTAQGLGEQRRAAHRRALLRRHPRLHGRPRRARGGPRRPDRGRPRRRHDHDRRRRAARIDVALADDEIAERRARPTTPPPAPTATSTGVLAKYAARSASAAEGADHRAERASSADALSGRDRGRRRSATPPRNSVQQRVERRRALEHRHVAGVGPARPCARPGSAARTRRRRAPG